MCLWYSLQQALRELLPHPSFDPLKVRWGWGGGKGGWCNFTKYLKIIPNHRKIT